MNKYNTVNASEKASQKETLHCEKSKKSNDEAITEPFNLSIKPSWLSSLLERILGLTFISDNYKSFQAAYASGNGRDIDSNAGKPFLSFILFKLNVHVEFEFKKQLNFESLLPKKGALVVIANHPLGGLEGVAITKELLNYRDDVKVLTNEVLSKIPELKNLFIGVDIFSDVKNRKNFYALKELNEHLAKGGILLIFPAGKVSAFDLSDRKIKDDVWHKTVGSLVQKHKVNCLPMYVKGQNSRLFYWSGLIHPVLRTLLLPRQLLNKKNYKLSIKVGELINYSELKMLENAQKITNYLRLSMELLSISNTTAISSRSYDVMGKARRLKRQQTLNKGINYFYSKSKKMNYLNANATKLSIKQNRLTEQDILPSSEDIEFIASLRKEFCIVSRKNFDVYFIPYKHMGSLMQLLGKNREYTFSLVGEGTGNLVDIDKFDPYYHHLFAWDRDKQCIVGGYRVGFVDQIVNEHGMQALYTRSLYQYDNTFLEQLDMALELGRSFIVPNYQKHMASLDVLWRGIGSVIAQNPQYYKLFGAVSISSQYSELARAFISETMLTSFRAKQDYINKVKPNIPLKIKAKLWNHDILSSLNNIAMINKLVGRCDPGKGIPVLLRQYIEMNGKFVTFTVNKGFNDALDGMIIADLRGTSAKYLGRYLGKQGMEKFHQYWKTKEVA